MRLLITLLCLLLTSPAVAAPMLCPSSPDYQPIAERPLKSLAYEITDCNGHESYILGTLHSSDPVIIREIYYMLPYLDASRAAWFELISHPDDDKNVAARMFLPASQTVGLREMLGKGSFAQLMTLIQTRAPTLLDSYVDRYQPWAATIILQTLAIDTSGVVMDEMLQTRATTRNVPIHALETIDDQFSIFERFSREEQLVMLRDAIEDFHDDAALNDQLVEYYKDADLHHIAELSASTFADMSDQEIRHKLEAWLVVDRNKRMARKLLPELKRGGVFIAVGALHLPDETGLLQAFEDAGYGIYTVDGADVGE